SSAVAFAALLIGTSVASASTLETFLREAAKANGFLPAEATHVPVSTDLVRVGERFFQSNAVSLNGDISCSNCHLDKFGSADGIPNAIGVGGAGEGKDRVIGGGAIIPRNTLP